MVKRPRTKHWRYERGGKQDEKGMVEIAQNPVENIKKKF